MKRTVQEKYDYKKILERERVNFNEKKLIAEDENFKVVTNSSIDCRPCLWDKRSCSCEELKCLDINTDKIIETVKKLTYA